MGVGEASFISLAAPVLDDEAPRDLRSVWLSIFYACISVGYAIGYTYGSFITQTLNLNWRYAFLSEAILISIPAIITTFTPNVIPIKSLGIKKDDKDKAGGSLQESITKKSRYSAIFHDLYRLFSIPVLVLNIMGKRVWKPNHRNKCFVPESSCCCYPPRLKILVYTHIEQAMLCTL